MRAAKGPRGKKKKEKDDDVGQDADQWRADLRWRDPSSAVAPHMV